MLSGALSLKSKLLALLCLVSPSIFAHGRVSSFPLNVGNDHWIRPDAVYGIENGHEKSALTNGTHSEGDDLRSLCRGQTRSAEAPSLQRFVSNRQQLQ